MPHQLGVTIQAKVAADQVPGLRKWLAGAARDGVADGPFGFARMRGLHFAKLYLLEETADLDGQPIPASLVLMSEVDAPLRRHLAELVDVAGAGIDQAFGYAAGYPGPAAHRRARIGWLRRHLVRSQRRLRQHASGAGWTRSARRRSCGRRWSTTSTSATGPAGLRPRCAGTCRLTWPGGPT